MRIGVGLGILWLGLLIIIFLWGNLFPASLTNLGTHLNFGEDFLGRSISERWLLGAKDTIQFVGVIFFYLLQ